MTAGNAQIRLDTWLSPRAQMPTQDDWAITADVAHIIISHIAEKRPRLIMELGSGYSTLVIGYALQRAGSGKLVSVEHNKKFHERSVQHVRDHGLEDVVEVWHCPLMPCLKVRPQQVWYDIPLQKLASTIDLLIVDGPQSGLGPQIRYPSVPALCEIFSPDVTILVDDASRPDEKKIVQRWLAENPEFTHEFIATEKGTSILRRRA